jgi:xylulokinase
MIEVSNAFLIGVDLGTTGCRAIVFDRVGRAAGTAYVEYEVRTPEPGWAEQDPDIWWQAAVQTLREAVAKAGMDRAQVAAIGVTAQQPSPVFVDREGQPLAPSLIWMDQRTRAECDEIVAALGADHVYRVTGLRVDPIYAATKVLWVRRHWPDAYQKAYKILLAKDYLLQRLTGEFVSDPATSGSTLLFDLHTLDWSREILHALQIPRDKLPDTRPSTAVAGGLRRDVAIEVGLLPGMPVYTCAGDSTAQAVGTRVVVPGATCAVIGTSCDVVTSTASPATDPLRRFGCYPHAVAGQYVIIAGANTGGACLRWFRDEFCELEVESAGRLHLSPYALMDLEAARCHAGAEGIVFLPYLMGERSPVFDSLARGVFFGASLRHQRAHFIRAILEGVACSIRHRVTIIEEQGVQVPHLYIAGGGGNSALWRQIVADVLGKPNDSLPVAESTCIGAVILAGVGAGLYPSVEAACAELLPVAGRCEPRPEAIPVYDRVFDVYLKLYEQTRSLWPQVDAIAHA